MGSEDLRSNLGCDWCEYEQFESQCPHLWNVDTTDLQISQNSHGGQIMGKYFKNCGVLYKLKLLIFSLLGDPVGPSP